MASEKSHEAFSSFTSTMQLRLYENVRRVAYSALHRTLLLRACVEAERWAQKILESSIPRSPRVLSMGKTICCSQQEAFLSV